jgi:hypothetical protein
MMGITRPQASEVYERIQQNSNEETRVVMTTLHLHDSLLRDVSVLRYNFRGYDFEIGYDRINRMSMLILIESNLRQWNPEDYVGKVVKSLLTTGYNHLLDSTSFEEMDESSEARWVLNKLQDIMGSSNSCEEFQNMLAEYIDIMLQESTPLLDEMIQPNHDEVVLQEYTSTSDVSETIWRIRIFTAKIFTIIGWVVGIVLYPTCLYWCKWSYKKNGAMVTIHVIYASIPTWISTIIGWVVGPFSTWISTIIGWVVESSHGENGAMVTTGGISDSVVPSEWQQDIFDEAAVVLFVVAVGGLLTLAWGFAFI